MATVSDPLQSKIIDALKLTKQIADTRQFASEIKADHQALYSALASLVSRDVVVLDQKSRSGMRLTADGLEYAEKGTPEFRLFTELQRSGGMESKDAEAALGAETFKIAQGKCMQNKWIKRNGSKLEVAVPSVDDTVAATLRAFKENPAMELEKKTCDLLKQRKALEQYSEVYYVVAQGANFEAFLAGTLEREYNFNCAGPRIPHGALHPLLKMRTQYRNIFLEMGFQEMPTSQFVESSFWNFDSLFQPQQHPARDAHDTFFVDAPSRTNTLPADYLQLVRDVHEKGGYGSIGYRYDWSEDESRKNIMRTHTTAVSSRMLYKLAKEGFRPCKLFSIDKVFRNEALDKTHLAEFHQCEGLICDRNLTLGNLIGVLKEFFHRLGLDNLRFKPAYNPYTEPSMEIFGFNGSKWIELGNSGMFRPEMLLPMGLPEDVRVIAWGLSLERPAMIKYQWSDIRNLCGHEQKVAEVRANPICRLDE